MMVSCNICLKKSNYNVYNDSQPLDDIKKKKISLSICKNCGFLFQNPKPTKKFLKKYYSKNINASGNVFFSKDQLKKTKYYQRFKFLDTSIELKNIKEVLEIGSSDSSFLNIFSNKKISLTGVDPSAKKHKNKRIKIIQNFFENKKFKKKKFDLICFFSVLEHVYNPKKFLDKVNSLQNKNDLIYLEIPNSSKPLKTIAEFYNFEHISHFNVSSIKQLLKSAGYEIKYKKIHSTFIRLIAMKKTFKLNNLNLMKNKNFTKMRKIVENYKKFRTKLRNKIKFKIIKFMKQNETKSILIYGAGIHAVYLRNLLIREFKKIDFLLDGNKSKKNQIFLSKKIKNIESLNNNKKYAVIISSFSFENEIFEKVKKNKNLEVLRLYS